MLGRTEEATRLLRQQSTLLDDEISRWASSGASVTARERAGTRGYALARTAARLGDVPEMTRRLSAALAAPNGVTPHYVRLDPAFATWRGRPEFEAVLARAPSAPVGSGLR